MLFFFIVHEGIGVVSPGILLLSDEGSQRVCLYEGSDESGTHIFGSHLSVDEREVEQLACQVGGSPLGRNEHLLRWLLCRDSAEEIDYSRNEHFEFCRAFRRVLGRHVKRRGRVVVVANDAERPIGRNVVD